MPPFPNEVVGTDPLRRPKPTRIFTTATPFGTGRSTFLVRPGNLSCRIKPRPAQSMILGAGSPRNRSFLSNQPQGSQTSAAGGGTRGDDPLPRPRLASQRRQGWRRARRAWSILVRFARATSRGNCVGLAFGESPARSNA